MLSNCILLSHAIISINVPLKSSDKNDPKNTKFDMLQLYLIVENQNGDEQIRIISKIYEEHLLLIESHMESPEIIFSESKRVRKKAKGI